MPIGNKKSELLRVTLKILRRKDAASPACWQSILYETDQQNATIASALSQINAAGDYLDTDGNPVLPIVWEHSCLQKKCGACAMVINGRPGLACDAFLKSFRSGKVITLEPLKKFSVLADLRVDRSVLFENLQTMGIWRDQACTDAQGMLNPGLRKKFSDRYDAARCLQCGCCLEVCPNVSLKDSFFGAAGFIPAARLLSELESEERERIRQTYLTHCYSGCGKSLACEAICPAEIDISRMLVHTNAAAFRQTKVQAHES